MNVYETIKKIRYFTILWLGQSVSSLGSSMTGFAITFWLYTKTGSALILSTSMLFILLPKMLGNIFAGPFVDRKNKKHIMIFTDLGSGLCTLILFLLMNYDNLEIWHIYCLNLITSILGCFQGLASDVSMSIIVPRDLYIKMTGLQSFSNGIIQMFSSILAVFLMGIIGIKGIFFIDFMALAFALLTLTLFVKIPYRIENINTEKKKYLKDIIEGFLILKEYQLLKILCLFFVFINFVSGITYYNLISPMILAKSGNNSQILAYVNGGIGLGAIIGGLLTTLLPSTNKKIRIIFLCTSFSFLFGDILLGISSNRAFLIIGGFMGSVFIPLITANSDYFWRTLIPLELQGRAFAFNRSVFAASVSCGLMIGGILADYFFEPFMAGNTNIFTRILGNSKGSGMGLIFCITGITGTLIGIVGFSSKKLKNLEEKNSNTKSCA
jgi:MFS family permease